MKRAYQAALLLAAAAAFGGPPLAADQGKGGDSTDWGCGGHPPTAATLWNMKDQDKSPAQERWRYWWYLNRPTILDVSYRVAGPDAKPAVPPVPEKWRDDVRAALREALDSSTVSIASEAALGLGRGGDLRDAAILVKVAGDVHGRQEIRRRAALGLGLMPVDTAPEQAAKVRDTLLAVARESIGNNDDRLLLWACAVYALGLRGDESALPRLSAFIERHRDSTDADHERGVHREVLASAVGTLGLFRNELMLPDLVDTLKDRGGSGNTRQRKAMFSDFAAYGLARIGDKAALPALCEAASDERTDVRRAALLALGAVAGAKDADAIAVLATAAATEKDDPARGMAALSLGRTLADSAPATIRSVYESSSSPTVRSFAALGLGLYSRTKPDRDVQAFLLAELEAKHPVYETGALCIANGLAVNMQSATRLTQIAKEEGETEMRSHAAFALGLLGIEAVAPQVLIELVGPGDPVIRHEAGLALGLARRRDGVDALIQMVEKGKNVIERGSAAIVLGRIAGAEAAPVLVKILNDEHELNTLRTCVAHGLGLLIDRSEGRKLGWIGADVNWINDVNRIWLQTEVLDQLLLIMD